MQRLPLEIQTLYAELLEQLTAIEARRAMGHVPGTFVTKTVKDDVYYYFQFSEPGGSKRQVYIGRKDDNLDRFVERYRQARDETAPDRESIQRLASLLRLGGAHATDTASARVLRSLSDTGAFHLGSVLIGTHAFGAIGNTLGVTWVGGSLRTADIDVAATRTLSVAIPRTQQGDVPEALESLEMGFLPVPALDRTAASTSFKVRGQALRVDLLTPGRRRTTGAPVRITRLNTAAKPLKFLDYLIEQPVRAAVIDGDAVLVNVPQPGRFALHKLIVANERPATEHAKHDKDLRQAGQVLSMLAEERPGDVALAWEALEKRGPGWVKRAQTGLAQLRRLDSDLAEGLELPPS